MRETPERLKLHRDIDTITRRLRYPINDRDDLAEQVRNDELQFYDVRIRASQIIANETYLSFITRQEFPMRDPSEVKRKLYRAFKRFVQGEMQELEGARIRLDRTRGMQPLEAVALHLLAKHGFRRDEGSDGDA